MKRTKSLTLEHSSKEADNKQVCDICGMSDAGNLAEVKVRELIPGILIDSESVVREVVKFAEYLSTLDPTWSLGQPCAEITEAQREQVTCPRSHS